MKHEDGHEMSDEEMLIELRDYLKDEALNFPGSCQLHPFWEWHDLLDNIVKKMEYTERLNDFENRFCKYLDDHDLKRAEESLNKAYTVFDEYEPVLATCSTKLSLEKMRDKSHPSREKTEQEIV